jgi:hypothetical protein
LLTDRCPHHENTPIGELCERCEKEGVGIVELDVDGEGVVTFPVPVSLAWELNLRLTDLVGDMWGRATLYVVPERPGSSWARTLLWASPEEVRSALEGQTGTED